MRIKKIVSYLSGPISDNMDGYKAEFAEAQRIAESRGRIVLSPATLPLGLTELDYMGIGLRMLCDAVGIPPEQTIVCGDAGNDFDMMRVGGFRVAMGNAVEELKREADFITADCEHDGVADVIDRFLLGEENR